MNKKSPVTDGACTTAPFFYLTKSGVPLVKEYLSSTSNGDLTEFYSWLVSGGHTRAVDMQFGCFNLRDLANANFVNAFLEFYQREKKELIAASKMSDISSPVTSFSGTGPTPGVVEKTITAAEDFCRNFVLKYFMELKVIIGGQITYKTPSTFYMTTY